MNQFKFLWVTRDSEVQLIRLDEVELITAKPNGGNGQVIINMKSGRQFVAKDTKSHKQGINWAKCLVEAIASQAKAGQTILLERDVDKLAAS